MDTTDDIIEEARDPKAWDLKEIADKSFNEVLAKAISDDKLKNVGAVMAQFQKGEAGAIKMVAQALSEHRYNEENTFPITDERYKQIIQMASESIGTGEI
jgi:hypothetical protein